MTVNDVLVSLLVAGLLLVAAKWLRSRVALFRTLFLPASVIAGVLALLLGPQVGGALGAALGVDAVAGGAFPEPVLESWSALPGLLINVVFAALFIGKAIPSLREIWRIAGPQVALGQAIAWGQYVVGILLAVALLTPVFGLDPIAGALIEIGFEGGHGTAAGLADTFRTFGFPEGADLALGLATVGLVAGVLLGTVLVNWGVRTGRITLNEAGDPVTAARGETSDDLDDVDDREVVARREGQTTDPLSLHVGYVAIAIALGWLLQRALAALERGTWGGDGGVELLVHMPLFPLAMLGGVVLQLVLDRTDRGAMVDRKLINRLGGMSLDLIIVAALGTLSLEALGGNLAPFVVLALAGIAWNVAAYLVLAPRIVPEHPYERGLGDFGQSMGMTVTGLLLMRIADPRNRSGGLEAFGYKQLLFEPVVGGGLFTAASIPLIAQFGPWPVLSFTAVLTVFWMVFGMRAFGPRRTGRRR
ncbi:MAG: sodium:glutamate symporter [Nocardiopsis sp. BM-2018]|nr:MAG: sodium:glutamate symporter [Nocardiopsis sp. BM-2018]